MMLNIPKEFAIEGVYLPPLLVAGILGLFLAWGVAMLLNRYRLSHFFYYPPLIFLALTVIFTLLIGVFIIPF
jgi:Protein of unknown function (DUF1656)